MTEPQKTPAGVGAIGSFHAHIYWQTPDQRSIALTIRNWISERFLVALGRVHDAPIGPHAVAMYQVAFSRETFASFAPWLMLNRQGLSVLIHPNTGRARDREP